MTIRTMQFAGRVGQWVNVRLNDGTEVIGTIQREGPTIVWVGPVMIYKKLIVMASHKDSLPPAKE